MSPAATAATAAFAGGPPDDERFMRLALALGARHLGLTWPNPSVGAIVVAERAGEPIILGQGVTRRGGRPHAERIALEMAGEATRGATLYVTLEPCSARSRSDDGPSCTDLVIEHGIRRLVIGAPDPSAFAHGAGFPRLEAAGVEVRSGVLAREATMAHRGHILRVTQGRPAVTLKFACTADGFAARRDGQRLLISGEASNARTHLLRAHNDVIMVGVGTVLADDPMLTVRLPGLEHRSPVRVIIDSRLRTPLDSQVVATASKVPTWIVATPDAPVEADRRLVAAGAKVMRVAGRNGKVDLTKALRLLAAHGVTRVFSEGGPTMGEALVDADLVDTFARATNCVPLGEDGVPALGPKLCAAIAERFTLSSTEDLGADRLEIFERTG
jgi:diaminohydroxyphosphoribosylaminopyrimidine deaminase / 5-amino-6-(5-phosphoribosylamino)uracil reductase